MCVTLQKTVKFHMSILHLRAQYSTILNIMEVWLIALFLRVMNLEL